MKQLQSNFFFNYNQKFSLECGNTLPKLEIAYTTSGSLSQKKDNVVWVFHALTGNANPQEWWSGLIGEGCLINPDQHFIVCANILGSCYGTTGPESIDPLSGKKYGMDFPLITIRDMVNAHELLRNELCVENIYLGIGGSMGGQQLLEWNVLKPLLFKNSCFVATNMRHSAWGIAFNSAQRIAMEADHTLNKKYKDAGRKGLKAARAIAMLSYRNSSIYRKKQTDKEDKIDEFKADSYQNYQGEKLCNRFTPHSYWCLTKAMDSHNIGRNRKAIRKELKQVKTKALVIGIKSDLLFSYIEQKIIAKNFENGKFELIESLYGHDGFLIETDKIAKHVKFFLDNNAIALI